VSIREIRPMTPGQRGMSVSNKEELTKLSKKDVKASKPLRVGKRRINGRNSTGRITMRRRGGGHKRKYRFVDFKRSNYGVEGVVHSIEYDPNRSANIAFIYYKNGDKRYILAPLNLKVDDIVVSGPESPIAVGNALPLSHIPVGSVIHNIELTKGKGGQIVRSAGTQAQLVAREGKWCTVKLPSSEMRMVFSECYATIGQVGNNEHMNIKIGKAGRSRWMGRRPKVRGVVMNPVDHPHGGGEGKTSGGRHPVSYKGVPTKGYRTRNKKKLSGKFIVKRRNSKK